MKVELQDNFLKKLNRQVDFIAQDKPVAARRFKKAVLDQLRSLNKQPYRYRKSMYFQSDEIRDLIFKGYTFVYKIDERQNVIRVFGLIKYQESP